MYSLTPVTGAKPREGTVRDVNKVWRHTSLCSSCGKKPPVTAMRPASCHTRERHSQASYALGRMWRASGIGCCDCPHLPTCGWPPAPCGAWRHSPLCCRIWLSGPPRSCCHRTPPRSSFCTHWNSASHSPRTVSRSIKQRRHNDFPERK